MYKLSYTDKMLQPLDGTVSSRGSGFVCLGMYAFLAIALLEKSQTLVLPDPAFFFFLQCILKNYLDTAHGKSHLLFFNAVLSRDSEFLHMCYSFSVKKNPVKSVFNLVDVLQPENAK